MNRLLEFLIRRKLLNALMAGAYFIAIVLLHDRMAHVSEWLEHTLTMPVYNKVMAVFGLIVLAAFLAGIVSRIMKGKDRLFKASCLMFTAFFMVVSSRMLLVLNAECIHFFQYALLSIPVFALTLHFGETVFWVTLLGAVDEAYQYFFLYPGFNYYDLNDVLLNLLGGAIGAVTLLIVLDEEVYNSSAGSLTRRRARGAALATISLLVVGGFMLFSTGNIQVYPADASPGTIVLVRGVSPSEGFWSPSRGKIYHILRPAEGAAVIVLLLGLYSIMDSRAGPKRQ